MYFPLQEVATLPVGPHEASSWFWAQARLGYCTLAIRAKVEGQLQWFVYLTHCIDKSAWMPIAVLQDLFARILTPATKEVSIWSDAGTHFRSRALLWAMGYKLFLDRPQIEKTSCEFFCENHGKSSCDGLFGLLTATRSAAALEHDILSLEELRETFADSFASRRAANPTLPMETYIVWTPPMHKNQIVAPTFTLRSLPVPITRCYSWVFKRADQRRQSLMGRGALRDLCTGIIARACLTTVSKCKKDNEFFPEIEQPIELDVVEPDCEGIGLEERDDFRQKVRNGWRMAYRQKKPEQDEPAKFIAGLEQKREILATALSRAPKAQRRRTTEQLRAAALAKQARARAGPIGDGVACE